MKRIVLFISLFICISFMFEDGYTKCPSSPVTPLDAKKCSPKKKKKQCIVRDSCVYTGCDSSWWLGPLCKYSCLADSGQGDCAEISFPHSWYPTKKFAPGHLCTRCPRHLPSSKKLQKCKSMGRTRLIPALELLQKQHPAPLFPVFTQKPVGIPMP